MLQELSVVEQRYLAVREVLDGVGGRPSGRAGSIPTWTGSGIRS